MGLNKGETLLRLTESCEIYVRNMGRGGECVALEITQRKAAGEDVTTLLLLCGDRARELASVLLHHSGASRMDGGEAVSTRGREEEVGAACAS